MESLVAKGLFVGQSQIEAWLGDRGPEGDEAKAATYVARQVRSGATPINVALVDEGWGNRAGDELGRRWDVGVPSRDRLVRYLVERRAEPSVVDFAIGSPGDGLLGGVYRNVMALLTAGQKVIHLDGIVGGSAPLPTPQSRRGLALSGSGDPRCWRSGGHGVEGAPNLDSAANPLVGSLSRVLGRTVGATLADEGGLELDGEIAGDALDRLMRCGGGIRIAAAVPGQAGRREETWQEWLSRLCWAGRGRGGDGSESANVHADGSSSVLAVEALALSLGTFCVDGAFGYDNRRASIPFAPLIPDADALFGAVLRLSSRDTCVAYVPEIAHRERGAGVPGGASSGRGAVKLEVSAFLRALITKVQPRHPIDSLDAWAAYVGAALEAVSSSGVPKFLDLAYECAHAEWMAALREVEDLLDSSVPDGAATKRVLSGLRRDLVCALRRPGEVVPRDSRQLRDHIGRLGRLIAAWPGLWAACAALPVEERLARFAAKA